MNEIVKETQESYRNFREEKSFSIIDIPEKMIQLAKGGKIWMIKLMNDISDGEEILLEYYLDRYQSNQIYDNLGESFHLQPSTEQSTTRSSQSSQKNVSLQKPHKKKKNTLEVRNVKLFNGYKKAKELEEKIIFLCQELPSYERNIVDQIGRSSNSIKKSISLGEQFYIGEKFKNYSDAIGSAKETSAWLQISIGQKYITQGQFGELDNLVNQVVCILTRTLCNIRENEGKRMDLPNPYTPDVNNFGAYKNSLLLVERIYEITKQREFWREKDLLYGMRKYATSCVANIAEAHQLYIPKKFRFFNNALEALSGLESSLETALSKGIISNDTLQDIIKLRESIRNILSKKMGNMSKQKVC